MILHGYFRSSAAFRVRIALNLKNQSFETIPHHLRKQHEWLAAYRTINPQGLVPALETGSAILTQSLAIIEYLEETIPAPPLLPTAPTARAHVRALAQIIACEIHPIDNLRVLNYLRGNLQQPEAEIQAWYNNWIKSGFDAIEALLSGTTPFCFGSTPGLADICLVPQVVNAATFKFDLSGYTKITRIFETCIALPSFASAHPKMQPDAE